MRAPCPLSSGQAFVTPLTDSPVGLLFCVVSPVREHGDVSAPTRPSAAGLFRLWGNVTALPALGNSAFFICFQCAILYKGRNVQDKEPWDSSDEAARRLTLAMFGTPEKVRIMAEMPKQAHNFTEAKEIISRIIDRPLVNNRGFTAYISKNSAKEILSGKAVGGSFEKNAHLLAVANIEKLFSNAIEPWNFELNPDKPNEGLKTMRRLYSPMFYDGRIVPVKLSVKEMKNKNEGSRLYSLRAIDIDLNKKFEVQVT